MGENLSLGFFPILEYAHIYMTRIYFLSQITVVGQNYLYVFVNYVVQLID